jgi:Ser/Thr protein kinase RdoA (MazF antagonist)
VPTATPTRQGFFHPATGRELLWDLAHTSKLRPHLADIPERARRQLAEAALDAELGRL